MFVAVLSITAKKLEEKISHNNIVLGKLGWTYLLEDCEIRRNDRSPHLLGQCHAVLAFGVG